MRRARQAKKPAPATIRPVARAAAMGDKPSVATSSDAARGIVVLGRSSIVGVEPVEVVVVEGRFVVEEAGTVVVVVGRSQQHKEEDQFLATIIKNSDYFTCSYFIFVWSACVRIGWHACLVCAIECASIP